MSSPSLSRPRALRIAIAGGVLASAIAAVILLRSTPPAPPAAPVAAAASPAPVPADVPLPPSSESDARLRDALGSLSSSHAFHRWLGADHLLDRVAVVLVSLAEDRNPAPQLAPLRPSRGFSVTREGDRLRMSDRAAARYDTFADVVASIDAHQAASVYATLHPLLEAAYHQLGYPGRPLDALVRSALQRVADAKVRDRLDVVRAGSVYVFADPALEQLGPLEKQFLRLGARNTRKLKVAARELASALGFGLANEPVAGAR